MTRTALPLLCLMLAACQPAPPTDLASCGGGSVLALIGQSVQTLPATGTWASLRVITPGMAVTEDYSQQRLNVTLDHADRIIGLACG